MLSTQKGPEMGTQQDQSPFELPKWLLEPTWLKFAEKAGEDDDSNDDDENEDDDDDADDDDDSDDEDEDEDDKDAKSKKKSKSDKGDEDTSGLKSALRKERQRAKAAEKEAKALRKFKETQERKGKSETDNAKADAQKAADKAVKLAERLRTNEINLAVIKAVQSDSGLKFRDIDDALSLVKRDDIEVEQDEDDPSDVEVDSDSVVKALKRLAKRKPHLLVSSDDDEEDEDEEDDEEFEPRRSARKATGSKVGSRGTRDKGKIKENDLYDRYPALQAGRPPYQASSR